MKLNFINIRINLRVFIVLCTTAILFIWCCNCSYDSSVKSFSEECLIISESKNYQIIKYNNLYYYTIFNKHGDISEKSVPFPKKPEILMQDDLIQISYQSGTGLSTKWSYYYDVKNNRFSKYFYSIYDKYNETIAYGSQNKIIIVNIFDDENYKEIKDFFYPLSVTAEPFIDVKFNEEGTVLEVTYLTGNDYHEVTECFDLIKNI